MGNNFYTKWIEGTTKFNLATMDPLFAEFDKVIGYHHNVIIHTDGMVEFDILTGKLSWTSTIRIYFNAANGNSVSNTIAAGSITLADNEFAYVTLNDTDTTVLTVSNTAITLAGASNFIAAGLLVLGYRNTASDQYFSVHLKLFNGTQTGAVQTTDATVTTLMSLTLTETKAYLVELKVVAKEWSTASEFHDVASYMRRALVYRATAGSAVQQGSTVDVWTLEGSSAIAWDVDIDVSGNDVRARVTGDAGDTIEWKGEMRIIEV